MTVQVWSIPASGAATIHITKLPVHGTLYDLGADATSTSRATQLTAVGQALTSSTPTSYVLYVPTTDAFGAPLDSFSYAAHARTPSSTCTLPHCMDSRKTMRF